MKVKILCTDQLFRVIDMPAGSTVGDAIRKAGLLRLGYIPHRDQVPLGDQDLLTESMQITLMPQPVKSGAELLQVVGVCQSG